MDVTASSIPLLTTVSKVSVAAGAILFHFVNTDGVWTISPHPDHAENHRAVNIVLSLETTWRVNNELWIFPVTIDQSKSSLQILWLLLENTHLETKRRNGGKPESERRLGPSPLLRWLRRG
jgi:hypothetical protein